MAGNRPKLQGSNITGVSGAQHGAKQNAAAMQRAGSASSTNYEFGTELSGTSSTGAAGSNTVGLSGGNITGVSGAQHGAKQNAAAMQRAGQKAGK